MHISQEESLEFIKTFVNEAKTWAEVEKQIREHGFKDLLRADDYVKIQEWWHLKKVKELSDFQLASEIEFWANGGSYASHLDGFYAIRPNLLTSEAKKRNWQIREMPSSYVINPPNYKPIAFKK